MMRFELLRKKLITISENDLPGEESQFKMLPSIRPRISWDEILDKNPTPAAVMLLLYPEDDRIMFTLMQRNTYKGAHSAQVSLPGGKLEEGESYLDAAIRETHEEIGVDISLSDVHFALTKVWVAPSKFLVTPYVATLSEKPNFNADEFEVSELLEVDLNNLLNDDLFVETTVTSSYVNELTVNAFMLNGKVVWGATAMMLSEFKDLVLKIMK